MTNIDQFESIFKAADKPRFSLESIEINSVLVVTDGDRQEAEQFQQRARDFLGTAIGPSAAWNLIDGKARGSVSELLFRIEAQKPQLICTHRDLHMPANEFPYSLGVYVDVLTQATSIPLLLMPRDEAGRPLKNVMAITDHLTGDHHLVSYAAKLTPPEGTLFLTHIEDHIAFHRLIDAIGKIPDIDTDTARDTILRQLLKEPHDYIASCREVLKEANLPIRIEEVIALGQRLKDYKQHIEEHEVDLLVMHTKDEDQLAMHGLAYPLVVELRNTNMLLL